jgi:hypothetical protein
MILHGLSKERKAGRRRAHAEMQELGQKLFGLIPGAKDPCLNFSTNKLRA